MKKIKIVMLIIFVILISYVMCSKKITTKNHVNNNPFGGPNYSNAKSNPFGGPDYSNAKSNPFGGPDYSNVKSNSMKVITYN